MQPTRRVQPAYPSYPVQPVYRPRIIPKPRSQLNLWLIAAGVAFLMITGFLLMIVVGLFVMMSSGRIFPGVSVAGVSLGGQSAQEAAATLTQNWQFITVRDGSRNWRIPSAQLGLQLDANATSEEAANTGRSDGRLLAALLSKTDLPPVLVIDPSALVTGVQSLTQSVDAPVQNATIRMVDGQLAPVAAVNGRKLDVQATVNRLTQSAAQELADGALDVVTVQIAPSVTDATPLLEKARALLASPLTLTAYDPVTNQSIPWSLPPAQWGAWLTTENTPNGVSFAVDKTALSGFLQSQSGSLGADRTIDIEKSIVALNAALGAGQPKATALVQYRSTKYTVSAGETLLSIAWRIGVPGWKIAKANPGINTDALGAGQVITLPPKDINLERPVIAGKRIVISISKQHMWVYENGAIKWDWIASTGISSSPTMPGVYQILSHEQSAYAGNWNLDMPHFMGIYEAVPGFTNGIHGMPTRGGYSILWESALGRPVTYGCILLSNANATSLYQWAEEGVVVEIQA